MNLVFASGFLVPQTIFHLDYFRGLPARYPDALFPEVPVNGRIQDRAQALARAVAQRFPTGEIHVIAHSMGGLDARYVLSRNLLGLAERIGSLSTVATPHRGSPLADVLVGLLPGLDAAPVRSLLNAFPPIQAGALGNLTTTFARQFNDENPDWPGVRYLSYFGTGTISLVLRATHALIRSRGHTEDERINDGIVSLASARWPTDLVEPPWDADHFAQVGHNLDTLDLHSSFDHHAAFARVIARATGA